MRLYLNKGWVPETRSQFDCGTVQALKRALECHTFHILVTRLGRQKLSFTHQRSCRYRYRNLNTSIQRLTSTLFLPESKDALATVFLSPISRLVLEAEDSWKDVSAHEFRVQSSSAASLWWLLLAYASDLKALPGCVWENWFQIRASRIRPAVQ